MRPIPTNCAAAATLALLVAVTGCGREASEASTTTALEAAAAPPAAAAPAPAPGGVPGAGAAPAAAAPDPRAKPKLTSLPATPVAAGDLRDAYFHWNGATVTFAGYPDTFFEEEDWSRVSAFTATGQKDAQVLVECDFAAPAPAGTASRTTAAVVRGTVTGRTWATRDGVPMLQLDDCALVAGADPAAAAGDPWALDGTPVPIQALYDAALGWQGRTVQVVGRYDSSTYSSAGDTQRHDLSDGSGRKAIGCSHQGEAAAPRSAVDQRDGVIVEGTIGEPSFNQVNLDDCRFVNRS